MFESMVAFLLVEHLAGQSFVPPSGPAGYERMLAKNRRPYKTADGYIAIMPYTTQQWTRFLECIGRTELLASDWVKDPVQRSAHVDALYQLIADAAPSRTTAEWLQQLNARDIPCGPVNGLNALFDEPHLQQAGLFEDIDHPNQGRLRRVRSPFRVAGLPRKPDRLAQTLGEGTESILREAGFGPRDIRDLMDRNIVAGPSDRE